MGCVGLGLSDFMVFPAGSLQDWIPLVSPTLRCSQVLFKFPPIAALIATTGACSIGFCLACYGATSVKPLRIATTNSWVKFLPKKGAKVAAKKKLVPLASRHGQKVTGKKNLLVKSQAYPALFGATCARLRCSVVG